MLERINRGVHIICHTIQNSVISIKMNVTRVTLEVISFMLSVNGTGPRIEPWGTPLAPQQIQV